jgi:hypothetical protein
MSEQDKRPVYMGNFERYKKEMQMKHDDVITKLTAVKMWVKYSVIIGGLGLGIAVSALAM